MSDPKTRQKPENCIKVPPRGDEPTSQAKYPSLVAGAGPTSSVSAATNTEPGEGPGAPRQLPTPREITQADHFKRSALP